MLHQGKVRCKYKQVENTFNFQIVCHALSLPHCQKVNLTRLLMKIRFLGSSPGSPKLSDSSTLEDAKNECLENPECTGITKGASSDYQLKNGTLLVTAPGVTTYMKSLIQWSSEYTGKILGGDNLGSFDTLEEAKNKCIVRLKFNR